MAGLQDEIEALRAQIAALTSRVYQLEQLIGAESAVEAIPKKQQTIAPTPVEILPQSFHEQGSAGPRVTQSNATMLEAPAMDAASLEKKIGQHWLNRIGIVAILVGVSYFLKYAFDNNWIGPGGRVAIGLLAGMGLVIWSESLRSHGHRAFSYSLKAIGIGTLYLSLWGAFQIYHLIAAAVAFGAMAIVTGSTIALSLSQDAELLASFALIGGFATPVLLSTGQNREVVLFSYVCSGVPQRIYYGDDRSGPAVYDYSRLFEKDPAANEAQLGAETGNVAFRARPDERPWSERHPAVLWVAIIATVLMLGGIAVRSMRSATS